MSVNFDSNASQQRPALWPNVISALAALSTLGVAAFIREEPMLAMIPASLFILTIALTIQHYGGFRKLADCLIRRKFKRALQARRHDYHSCVDEFQVFVEIAKLLTECTWKITPYQGYYLVDELITPPI